VFAVDDETCLDAITRLLDERRLAVAEVATAGMVTHRLSALPGFAGGMTTPNGNAIDLAHLARREFGADVGLGVSTARLVEDSGQQASEVTIAVVTDDGTHQREMRFFGTGEQAWSYATSAALHVLRQRLGAANERNTTTDRHRDP
jgi:nicotinamide mononucleotide (NMN) deamidase PncC